MSILGTSVGQDEKQRLIRLNHLLKELQGKTAAKQRVEILTNVRTIYESTSRLIYTEANDICKTGYLISTVFLAAENEARESSKKHRNSQKFDAVYLLATVLEDVSTNMEILEDEDEIVKNILDLFSHEAVLGDSKAMRDLSEVIYNIICTIGPGNLDENDLKQIWSFSWRMCSSISFNDPICSNHLRILTRILEDLQKTALSIRLDYTISKTIATFFETIERWKENENSWPKRLNYAVLVFLNLLVDKWGVLFRDQLLDRLLDVVPIFIGRLGLDTADTSIEEPEWDFFDRLTTLAFPDCRPSTLVNERVFGVATAVADCLLKGLEKMSTTRPGFVIPSSKAPLFAKLVVIAELSSTVIPSQPNDSKRSKVLTPLETVCQELLADRGPNTAVNLSSVFLLLEQVVKNWSHRLGPDRLSNLARIVLKLPKTSLSHHMAEYCRLLSQLAKAGILGNSANIKSEEILSNPMVDPRVTIKGLWKVAVSSAHGSSSPEAAMDLMISLVENFKGVLAPEEDDHLVETICSVISSQHGEKMLELLSLMLASLEFDELKSFSGAENKENGIQNWSFRSQIGEHLLSKVTGDVSFQLYQLCCYHPPSDSRRGHTTKKNKLEESLELCGLIESRDCPRPEVDEKLGACLIHELVEYLAHVALDKFTQAESNETRLSLFTTILSLCGYFHDSTKVTKNIEALNIVGPLLHTVNEWLCTLIQSDFDLSKLDPGNGSRFISSVNRRLLQERAEECPPLYARFPTDQEIPASKMKPFLVHSMEIIKKYGDFPVVVHVSRIKEESLTHRLSLKNSLSFSKYLAETVTTFIEEKMDFLPDVITLVETSRSALERDHLERILKKAGAIIEEDTASDSEEMVNLKKRLCINTLEPPFFSLIPRLNESDLEKWNNLGKILSPSEEEARQLLARREDGYSLPVVIQQGLVRWFLTNSDTYDISRLLLEYGTTSELRKVLADVFPESEEYIRAIRHEKTFLNTKGEEIPQLDLFRTMVRPNFSFFDIFYQAAQYRSLKMGNGLPRLMEKVVGEVADGEEAFFSLLSLIGTGICGGMSTNPGENVLCQKALLRVLLSLLEGIETRHEMEQLIYDHFSSGDQSEESKEGVASVCQGVIEKIINGGGLERIGFALTKVFWRTLKSTLTPAIVSGLEDRRIHLYDEILFFWDVLPQMRPEIAELMPLFEQSRENSARRGGYEREEMKKMVRNFCLLRIMDPSAVQKGETAVCLRILEYLSYGKTSETSAPLPGDSKDPASLFCSQLIRHLNETVIDLDKELFDLLEVYSSMPVFANLLAPFLCSMSKETGKILIELTTISQSPITDLRFIRTLAECVDGCGLYNLANLDVDGSKLTVLGHILLRGGYSTHAYAIANLAFDKFISSDRNLAAFGGSLPSDEGLWHLLGLIYLQTKNCNALDSLPRYMQDHLNVQLLRAVDSNQWLQVAQSPAATEEERLWAKWFCGIETHPKGSCLKYLDAVIGGKWEVGYPKKLDTHHKRLYSLIKNQNHYVAIITERIREMYLEEIASSEIIPTQICKNLFDLEVATKPQLTEAFLQSLPLEQLSLLMWKMYRHCVFLGDPDATISFTDYRDCFQVSALLLLEKLKQKKAFMAALTILPVVQSITSHEKLANMRLAVKECEIHIEMGHHQLAENKLFNLSKAIRLHGDEAETSQPGPHEMDIGIDVVCLLSKIRADHSSRNVEHALVPLKALNTCNMTNDRAAQHVYTMALRQLQAMEAYMESPMIKLRKEARERHKKELQALRFSGTSNADEVRRNRLIGKEYSCEREELQRLDDKLFQAACFAVQSAIDLLEFICNRMEKTDPVPEELKDKTMRVIFPLIDLVFRYEKNDDVVAIFKNSLPNFAPSVWLPTLPHLLPHCFLNGPLSDAINALVVQMLIAYPFHTVLPLLSYKYNQLKLCTERASIVESLLQRAIRSQKTLELVVRDISEAHDVYRKFVWLPLKKDNISKEFEPVKVHGKDKYKISATCPLLSKIKLLRRVPIPTVTQPVGRAKDYGPDSLILWAHIDPHCEKADGNSSPKVLRVKGSNGTIYKMVWKDGESVRQDSLVQDLFSVMSGLLETNLRTYNVVPLDSHSGIIEFCGGTQSIKDLLIGADSQSGLHHEVYPDETVMAVRKKMNQIQITDRTMINVQQFKSFLKDVTPVFRHHFYRSFPRAYDWNAMIQQYTESLAQWSIVCYVVGLGDRHGSNVLFESRTSSFVHIDLGMILEFSRRMLPIPELVPFRMTRDLLDPILVQGIKGSLAYKAAEALDKTRKNKDVILGVASVFLRETVSNFKDTTDDKQRSFASATAFGRLQAKLNGTDATISPVSATEQTNRLLSEATDLENLSKLFSGWLAII